MLSTLAPRQSFALRSSAHRTIERINARIRNLREPDASPEPEMDFGGRDAMPDMSVWDFLAGAWHVIEPSAPLIDSWHLRAMCDHGEALVTRKLFRRLLVNVPPGTTKSTIFSVVIPCWVWTFRPWFRWYCASYDQDTANDLAMKRRQLLVSDWYRSRWPIASELVGNSSRKARDTIKQIQNVAGGEMLATSPGGRGLGKHPHGIALDDLHNPKDSESMRPESLKKVENWLRNVVSTRGAAKDISALLMLVMQRLSPKDSSAIAMELWPDIEHLCLSMEYKPNHSVRDPKKPTALGFVDPRTEPGELLCPDRFGPEEVASLRKALRPHGAAGQLDQEPTNLEGDRFRRTWFKVVGVDQLPPKIYSDGKAVRYWDKAGTQGDGDFTAGVLLVQFEGKFYVMDVIRGQWGAAARKLQIKQATERDDKLFTNYVVWQEREPSSGGKESAENTESDLADFKVRTDVVRDPKHVRYNDWEEELDWEGADAKGEQHPRTPTVFLVEGAWNQPFIDEHCAWRWEDKNPTDDQIDAAAGGYMKLRRRRSLVAGAA